MLLLLGWVSEIARLTSYLRCDICMSFRRAPAARRGFSSQKSAFSVREKGREGTASCAGGKGRRFSRSVLRSLPVPAVGAPRCPPAPRVSVCLSGKAGGVDLLVFCFVFFTSGEEQPPAGRGRCRRRGAGLLSPPWKVFNRFSQIARR